jgi:methylated-DNA-[protein]-cysteine S-methyltransferase
MMSGSISTDTPVGKLTIREENGAIVAIGWHDGGDDRPTPLLTEAVRQLQAYFRGEISAFDLPLKPSGTAFDQKVWQAMRDIPPGETRSYADLAHAVGSAPRAIGRACGRNPIPIVIPCHRVLSRGGIGGYSGGEGLPTKRRLLALEGATVP